MLRTGFFRSLWPTTLGQIYPHLTKCDNTTSFSLVVRDSRLRFVMGQMAKVVDNHVSSHSPVSALT